MTNVENQRQKQQDGCQGESGISVEECKQSGESIVVGGNMPVQGLISGVLKYITIPYRFRVSGIHPFQILDWLSHPRTQHLSVPLV